MYLKLEPDDYQRVLAIDYSACRLFITKVQRTRHNRDSPTRCRCVIKIYVDIRYVLSILKWTLVPRSIDELMWILNDSPSKGTGARRSYLPPFPPQPTPMKVIRSYSVLISRDTALVKKELSRQLPTVILLLFNGKHWSIIICLIKIYT